MRKIFLLICIFLTITSNAQYGDNYKTILAYPSDADIYINNEHVGKGNYNVNLEYKDRVIVTVKKTGYITATYTLFKNNPNQTITYKLEEDEAYKCMLEAIKHYESYDNIWQTRNNWTAIYSKSSDEEVDSIYIALVNHTSKEYLITITNSLQLEPEVEDEYFEFVTKEEHIEKIEQLKTAGYKSLSCSIDYYYEEILMCGES